MHVVYYCAAAAILAATNRAWAQSAMIQVFHDDLDGIIDPGQVVRVDYHLTWTEWQVLGRMKGDAVATPNRGVAGPATTGFGGGFPFVQTGMPDGGSVRGFHVWHVQPVSFIAHGFGLTPQGTLALSFEWTAPGPEHAGPITFDFEFDPVYPGIYLFPSELAPKQIVPTTVVPATLTVIPAPWSSAILAAGAPCVMHRRRA